MRAVQPRRRSGASARTRDRAQRSCSVPVTPAPSSSPADTPSTAAFPDAIRDMSDFRLTDAQWDSLLIPIEMAFFYRNSTAGRVVAVYPSPAGATESLLPLETWDESSLTTRCLATMEPDVEALVVNRLGVGTRQAVFIDHRPGTTSCRSIMLPAGRPDPAALEGTSSGGAEVWDAIAGFFADIGRGRSRAGGPCLTSDFAHPKRRGCTVRGPCRRSPSSSR